MNCSDDPREVFVTALLPLLPLDDAAQRQLYDALDVCQHERKKLLLVNGKPGDRIHFLYSGLVRSFYIDKRDREVNGWFAAENDFIPPPYDMPNHQPTLETVEFLEKSVMVWLTRDKLKQLHEQY